MPKRPAFLTKYSYNLMATAFNGERLNTTNAQTDRLTALLIDRPNLRFPFKSRY
jgi:hypothetical protein